MRGISDQHISQHQQYAQDTPIGMIPTCRQQRVRDASAPRTCKKFDPGVSAKAWTADGPPPPPLLSASTVEASEGMFRAASMASWYPPPVPPSKLAMPCRGQ
jgi:hypothetical protein